MANPLTSSQFVKLLDKRFTDVFEGLFTEIPPMIDTKSNPKSMPAVFSLNGNSWTTRSGLCLTAG
jgi:hypothetical protein